MDASPMTYSYLVLDRASLPQMSLYFVNLFKLVRVLTRNKVEAFQGPHALSWKFTLYVTIFIVIFENTLVKNSFVGYSLDSCF